MKIFLPVAIIMLGFSLIPSCKDESGDVSDIVFPDTGSVSYTKHVQPLFDRACAFIGCHGDDTKVQRGFSLTDYGNFMTGAHTQIVFQGNPDQSPLILRIEGKMGIRMPLDRPPLNQNQIKGLRRWVIQGAPQN